MAPSAARVHRILFCAFVLPVVVRGCGREVDAHVELIRDLDSERPFVLRLSGLNGWRPCELADSAHAMPLPGLCGGWLDSTTAALRLAGLSARVRTADAGEPSSLRVAAMLDVLFPSGAGANLDAAVGRLLELATRADATPDVLNDLAVAYTVRAQARSDASDLVRALDVIERAVASTSRSSPAVLFNRALLLDNLGLGTEAIRAWNASLAADASSPWAAEARTRLTALTADAVDWQAYAMSLFENGADIDAYRQLAENASALAREHAADHLLLHWGRAVLAADTVMAGRCVSAAREIGALLTERNRDGSIAAAVADIDAATRARDDVAVRSLARGHIAYGEARLALNDGDFDRVDRQLGIAAQSFDRTSPFHGWTEVYRAVRAQQTDAYDASLAAMRNVAREHDATVHPALVGMAHWVAGVTVGRMGLLERAIHEYGVAIALLERAGERDRVAGAKSLIAESLSLLGSDDGATGHLLHALHGLRAHPRSPALRNALLIAGQQFASSGASHAAVVVHRESVAYAERLGSPLHVVEATLRLARSEIGNGAEDSARVHIAAAAARLNEVDDASLRDRMGAELAEVNAELYVESDPVKAALEATRVIDEFSQPLVPARLIPALVLRGRALENAGNVEAASVDLAAAIDLVEREAADIAQDSLRLPLYGAAEGAFDAMIRVHADAGSPSEALRMLERSRGVDLPRVAVASGSAVLVWAVLSDRLITWLLAGDEARMSQIPIARPRLRTLVERFENALRTGLAPAGFGEDAALQLNELLLGAIDDLPDGVSTLVLVPDRMLQRVPFAALRDAASGQWLIERFTLRWAPDVATALLTRESARTSGRTLLVGNPAFDRNVLPGLSALRAAAREIDGIAKLRAGATIVTGAAATRSAFLTALPGNEIVHFAGHARFRADRPDRSDLVLAPDDSAGSMGLVHPADIAALDLAGMHVVVLAACSSLGADETRIGGFGAFARAFIEAGALGVIGSAWAVDDDATADLLVAFHRAYAESGDAAGALRSAQLTAIHDATASSPVATWAAFRYVGSATTPR